MRPNILIRPLCGLVLLTTAGCPESNDESDDTPSNPPGADPLVGAWNLDEHDGVAYPYTYDDEGCMITYSASITFDADLRGTLLGRTDYGFDCGNSEDYEEYTDEYEAVPAGANGYDMAVCLPPPANVHESYSCTLSDSTLTCEDDEGITKTFVRA